MTRILHTGDTHLGYQQYHLPERREDFRAAFAAVVDDAVAEDVDAVVHAGDLFHDRQPRLGDIMGALQVLRRLDDADIPFLAIVGNHEAKRSEQWLDLYESMGLATRLGSEPTDIGDVAVYGLDFVARSQREALDYEFEPHDAAHAALVSHGLFEPFDHGDWDVREILAESPVDFDAVLLGDDHEPQTKRLEEFDAWVTYCGSTERASASERDARGYNLVTFDGEVDIRRREIETRQFRFVDVNLAPGEGSERVRERIAEYDLTDAVVIVTITGEGEAVMPAGIEEYAEQRDALVTRVNDRREFEEETEVEVSFADPDDAVARRIEEMGLSAVARDLDETIRASKVPDSRVADEVERRVRDLLDDAGPDAFDPAGGEDADRPRDFPDEGDGDRNEEARVEDDTDGQSAGGEETAGTDDQSDDAGEDQVTMEEYR